MAFGMLGYVGKSAVLNCQRTNQASKQADFISIENNTQ